jgi:hypothetical protein
MVVAAGGVGVLVSGVVLHVAQDGAGVQRERDRRVPQRVRGQSLPTLDAGGPGQPAHQLPQVPLGPTAPRRPLRPGSPGRPGRHPASHRRRGERHLGPPGSLAHHPQHPTRRVGTEVGDVRRCRPRPPAARCAATAGSPPRCAAPPRPGSASAAATRARAAHDPARRWRCSPHRPPGAPPRRWAPLRRPELNDNPQ